MGYLHNEGYYVLDQIAEDGSKRILGGVHAKTKQCLRDGCPLHAPSKHPLNSAPQGWDNEMAMITRQCACGAWHPDKDSYNFMKNVHHRDLTQEEIADDQYLEKFLRGMSADKIKRITNKLRQADGHVCCQKRCCQEQTKKIARNPFSKVKAK